MSDGRRDRLSSLDLVPDHAQDDVVWAVRELNTRTRSNADILFELNDRLAVKGVDPISSSAFGRKALRQKALRQRMENAREALSGVLDLSAGEIDETTIKLGHVIMMLIADLAADGVDRSAKELKEIADAFRSIVNGQKVSAERRRKIEAEADAKAAAKTAETVEKVAREGGLSADVISQLRREFLGVRQKPASGSATDGA